MASKYVLGFGREVYLADVDTIYCTATSGIERWSSEIEKALRFDSVGDVLMFVAANPSFMAGGVASKFHISVVKVENKLPLLPPPVNVSVLRRVE